MAVTKYVQDEVPQLLRDTHRALGRLVNTSTLENSREILELLHQADFAHLALRLIEEICGDQKLLSRCAERSDTHPLGFDKLVLLSTRQYQLRLHIWRPAAENDALGDIHDHRFDFVSSIIAGRIVVETYQMGEGRLKEWLLDKAPSRLGDPYLLVPMGSTFVKAVAAEQFCKGSAYVTSATSLHRVIPDRSTLAATLFLKLPSYRQDANVLAEPPAQSRGLASERIKFTADLARSTLQDVLASISG